MAQRKRKRGIPDWVLYGGVILLVLYALGRDDGDVPEGPAPPPPVIAGEGSPLGPSTPLDDVVIVEVNGRPQPGLGTAFAIDGSGVWLTARHVVDGCRAASLVTGPDRGVPVQIRIARDA
jgi:hypothetical protein